MIFWDILGIFVWSSSQVLWCDIGKLEILKYITNFSKEIRQKDDSFKLNLFTVAKKLKNTIAVLEQRKTIARYLLQETDYCKDESHPNIIMHQKNKWNYY